MPVSSIQPCHPLPPCVECPTVVGTIVSAADMSCSSRHICAYPLVSSAYPVVSIHMAPRSGRCPSKCACTVWKSRPCMIQPVITTLGCAGSCGARPLHSRPTWPPSGRRTGAGGHTTRSVAQYALQARCRTGAGRATTCRGRKGKPLRSRRCRANRSLRLQSVV